MERNEWEITWGDFLSVGVLEIDKEHQQFIARVNAVNKAIVEAQEKVTVERLMDSMLMEATRHFQHEQLLLEKWKYPEAKDHAKRHEQLISQFNRTIKEFREDNLSFVWALKGLRIKQWLVEHLLQEDMKYKDFLLTKQGPH